MFSGTGPCGVVHSPAGAAAAADMMRDDPRTESVVAARSTRDTCLGIGTTEAVFSCALWLTIGLSREAEVTRSIDVSLLHKLFCLGDSCGIVFRGEYTSFLITSPLWSSAEY